MSAETDPAVGRLRPGDAVYLDAIDGFGGPARVVEVREHPTVRCKVLMDNGSQPAFWAHDAELTPQAPGPDGVYDSRADTLAHVGEVRRLLGRVATELQARAARHDASKLESPEKEAFDAFTPKLARCTYGSEEYRGYLAAMKPALDHHYAHNDHHPEWFGPDGIGGMSLVQVLEMLCDWAAACSRHNDGDIRKSIEINQARFGYGDELKRILLNTLPLLEGEEAGHARAGGRGRGDDPAHAPGRADGRGA